MEPRESKGQSSTFPTPPAEDPPPLENNDTEEDQGWDTEGEADERSATGGKVDPGLDIAGAEELEWSSPEAAPLETPNAEIQEPTASTAPEVQNDTEAHKIFRLKNIPRPCKIKALRYHDIYEDVADLSGIRMCCAYVKSIDPTQPATAYLAIRSFNENPYAAVMCFNIYPEAIEDIFFDVEQCVVTVNYDPNKCEKTMPIALAQNPDLTKIFTTILKSSNIQIYLDSPAPILRRTAAGFLDVLRGKRQLMEEVKKKIYGGVLPVPMRSQLVYQRCWEIAIKEEFEAEAAAIKERLGGRIGLALNCDNSVQVYYPRGKMYTNEIHKLEGRPSFKIQFPSGKTIQAFANPKQVDRYNEKGFLELSLSNSSEEDFGEIKKSSAGELTLIPRASDTRKRREEFTINGLMNALNEETLISFQSLMWANRPTEIGETINNELENSTIFKNLDKFQKTAFQHILHEEKDAGEIVLVSGPAGTGKTLTAASSIVAAMKHQPQRLPILVITEKNTAVANIFTACIKILGQDTADFNILFLQSKFATLTLKERNRDVADLIYPFTMKSKIKDKGGKPEELSWTDFKAEILSEQTIVFTTINLMYQTRSSWKDFSPKMLVLDDAAATTELNSLLAWLMFRHSIGRFVLIGDEAQLKPYSISGNGQMLTSLFERLRISDWPTANLQMNHRMADDVSALAKTAFYPNRELENAESTMYSSESVDIRGVLAHIFPGSQKNVIWSNITGTESRMGQYTYHDKKKASVALYMN
ncbi:NFX1-type zinc finger-containing protein 1 [Orbilia oligospora]|uniref:NFX1-type zinc finger-containing protein 1 n=1 Tax=Orbilia oligospora TaxID=2813651 RepID=A0A7C8RCH3_ORBOL|nr:NFX1-type zinc finger-containing protein 1 [Orbilia oligospora]